MRKINIFIADDHNIFREGVRNIIALQQDMQVVGEADDGLEAVKKVKTMRPDIAVLDIAMPGLNGLEAIALIREAAPETKIILLSMHTKEAYVYKALTAGAMGYVHKAATSQELLRAIREVYRGDYCLSSKLNQNVISLYLKKGPQTEEATDYDSLSDREQQVLRLTVEGKSVKETAELLFLSAKTVEKHRANIMKKLGINNAVELVKYAIKIGIVDPDLWE